MKRVAQERATPLIDLVEFLFSKNAGPYLITFDIIFKDPASFRRVCESGIINRATVSRLYRVAPERVISIYEYEPGRIIKFSIARDVSSGDFGDRSVFGSQQWSPLIDLPIPARAAALAGATNGR